MDVREKLVELCEDLETLPSCATYEEQAEHLLSDGAMEQEWISVKDRLPEDDSDVWAYSRNGKEGRIYPANYAKGVWFDCIFTTPATDTTTHWMPIPEPPKGE